MDLRAFTHKKICVAISGGVDSVALLQYMHEQAAACGFTLSAVHCQHGIRGEESVEDMRFVQAFCARLGVETYTFEADCIRRAEEEKCSVETAARNFRRETFARLLSDGRADFIATAHHRNDEAETVLFRIARGAGLSGASGMKERDGQLIRPFLRWSKARIRAYAEERGLAYRVDSTNLQTEYTRNKLRLEVLPKLEEAVSGATENLARFAEIAAEDDEYLYAQSAALIGERADGWLVAFCEAKPLFRRACLTVMKALGVEKDYTLAHLESVYALQEKERGARVDLPQGIVAKKTADGIVLSKKTTPYEGERDLVAPFSLTGFDGGRYAVSCALAPFDGEGKTLVLDMDKLPRNAVFRFRREGDTIRKFGGGRKTLKKFFNEKKIEPEERGWLPLVADRDSGVVYVVCGVEIADEVKVDENTKQKLYIRIEKNA